MYESEQGFYELEGLDAVDTLSRPPPLSSCPLEPRLSELEWPS
jgi:hypothetical protein